jgi:hypothetical protein
MEKFLEYAYDKFILRDVCAYIFPGALLLIVAAALFCPETLELFGGNSNASVLVYIFVIVLAYVVGLIIQSIGTIRCEYDWWRLVRYFPGNKDPQYPVERLREEYELQVKSTPSDDKLHNVTERIVVLMMMHGNLAISFFLVAVLLTGKIFVSCDCKLSLVVLLGIALVLGLVLLNEHGKLVYRLRLWRTLAADRKSSS